MNAEQDSDRQAPSWWNCGDADPYLGDGPGGAYFTEAWAVLRLLADDRVFISSISRTEPDHADVAILAVSCNDVFYWACADCEHLPWNEIRTVYEMHIADPAWGTQKWCCRRRKLRPQVPIVRDMKAAGVWDDELEALPAPAPS